MQLSETSVLSSFLNIAGTSNNEIDALAALQKARSIMDNMGITFESLLKARIHISELERKILLIEGNAPAVQSPNGFYRFQDLQRLVVGMTNGVVHGWQTALAEASKGSEFEIDLPLLQKWRQNENFNGKPCVPSDYYTAASKMTFGLINSEKIHYTEEEKIAFNSAYDEYQSLKTCRYADVAENLSEHLKRKVTENSVKRAFDRIKLFRFVLFHIKESKANQTFDGKNEKQLAEMFTSKIGRTVSSKLVKAALSSSTRQVW